MKAFLFFALFLGVFAQRDEALTTSQLYLNAAKNQVAQIRLGQGKHEYDIGAGPQGFFIKLDEQNLMEINEHGEVEIKTELFSANSLAADNLILGGVPQWHIGALETFDATIGSTVGWNTDKKLVCPKAGMTLLVGEASLAPGLDTMYKTFTNLPKHDQVRIQGTLHFVDDWQGETAYFKLNDNIVWTDAHDQRNAIGKIDVCGSETYPESRFAVPFDVSIPHKETTIKVALGSTVQGSSAVLGLSTLTLSFRSNIPSRIVFLPANTPPSATVTPVDQKPPAAH